jgi:hypothetical protein
LLKVLNLNSRISVLGERTTGVREQMNGVFLEVVRGASDAPKEKQAKDLGDILYALHLAILLYRFHDRTPEVHATRELVRSACEALRFLRPALRLPPTAQALSRLAGVLGAVGTGNRHVRGADAAWVRVT